MPAQTDPPAPATAGEVSSTGDRAAAERPPVQCAVRHGVAVLTLDRAPHNALDPALVGSFTAALDACEVDDRVRVVVVTGAGSRFAVGADVGFLRQAGTDRFDSFVASAQHAVRRLEELPMPTIAAVNGDAVGGGLELALGCDLRIAADHARVGLPEARLGLLPGAGGTQRLRETLGRTTAFELLYLGTVLPCHDVRVAGLFNRVVAPGQALPEALAMARTLVAGARECLPAVKRCVLANGDAGRLRGFEVEQTELRRLYRTPEAEEGLAAFLERRPPRFGREPTGADG